MSKFIHGPNDHDDADDLPPTGYPSRSAEVSNLAPFPDRSVIKPAPSGPSNRQVLVWSLLGAGALSYLLVSTFAPDLLRSNMADAGTATQAVVAQTQESLGKLTDDVAELKQSVAAQSEDNQKIKAQLADSAGGVQELRRQVSTVVGQTQGLDERLAQLEAGKGAPKQSTRIVPVQPATTQNAAVKPAPAETMTDGGIDGLVMDEPAPAGTAAKPQRIATVAQPTPLVPKAAVPAKTTAPAGGSFGIELAVSTSPEALRLNWEILNEQHQAALQGLQARSAPAGDNFRLLAGPFANAQQANAACGRLKQRGLSCKPSQFVGSAL